MCGGEGGVQGGGTLLTQVGRTQPSLKQHHPWAAAFAEAAESDPVDTE